MPAVLVTGPTVTKCYLVLLTVPSLVVAENIASTHCAYPRRDGQATLAWVAGYIPRWYTRPKTVTHLSTNRPQRRVTSLISPTPLPRRQTAAYRQGRDESRICWRWCSCAEVKNMREVRGI